MKKLYSVLIAILLFAGITAAEPDSAIVGPLGSLQRLIFRRIIIANKACLVFMCIGPFCRKQNSNITTMAPTSGDITSC